MKCGLRFLQHFQSLKEHQAPRHDPKRYGKRAGITGRG
jgi:hypothetical protein